MIFPRTKKYFRAAVATGLAVGVAAVSTASHALDTTANGPIGTALTGAVTDAVAAGGLVIACVAGVVVIGMVIAMVRKA